MKSTVVLVAVALIRKNAWHFRGNIVSIFRTEELAKKEAAVRIPSCWILSWLTLRPRIWRQHIAPKRHAFPNHVSAEPRRHFYRQDIILVRQAAGRVHSKLKGSVVYNCCWSSLAQSFSGTSPVGLATAFTVSDLRLPFSSPRTTLRVTVEVFDPTSTWDPCLVDSPMQFSWKRLGREDVIWIAISNSLNLGSGTNGSTVDSKLIGYMNFSILI
jgi:hypothetical protein